MAFCSAMNNYTLNEKNCISLTLDGSSNEDLGLVNLYNDAVGKRGKNSKIDTLKYDNLFDYICNKIDKLEEEQKKTYISYFIKLLFLIRDHKDGNGERDIFYTLFYRLYNKYPKIVVFSFPLLTGGYSNINDDNYDEDVYNDKPFGSFLDLNKLYDLADDDSSNSVGFRKHLIDYYINCLKKDIRKDYPSLAVKWIPREKKKYHDMACDIVDTLFNNNNMEKNRKFKNYRKLIKVLSDKMVIIEQLMTENRWDEIEVKNIPSRALKKYLYAFKNENKTDGKIRHPNDIKRMELRKKMLLELNKSAETTQLNVTTLQPYEIVKSVISYGNLNSSEEENIIAMWNKYSYEFKKKLETDKLLKENLNMIILADVSGSMTGTPLEACLSLSLLLTDILDGVWKNKILTFESNPKWHNIPEDFNIVKKIEFLKNAPWGGSTNIGRALEMILNVALVNKISKEDMPKKMVIFSDMQFDQAIDYHDQFKTGFEILENKFKSNGYDLPHIIFWNLRGDTLGYNNKTTQKGTTMLSGFGPASFKSFMNADFNIDDSPWQTLKNLLSSSRLSKLDDIIKKYL
tara:strand:- start:3502 stop:5217 length:1716 start_codon:yes stop_codon:yes gene_type:complete